MCKRLVLVTGSKMYNNFIDLCCVLQVLQLDNVEVFLKLPSFLCNAPSDKFRSPQLTISK